MLGWYRLALRKIFGNVTASTSPGSISGVVRYSRYTPAYTGDVVSLTAYVYSDYTTSEAIGAIYEYDYSSVVGGTICIKLLAITKAVAWNARWTWVWVTFPFEKEFRVVKGHYYCLAMFGNSTAGNIGYAAGQGGYAIVATYPTFPADLTGEIWQPRDHCIYCTYDPSSSLHVDLGAHHTRIPPDTPTLFAAKQGKFGGYCGMGKAHTGLRHRSASRIY